MGLIRPLMDSSGVLEVIPLFSTWEAFPKLGVKVRTCEETLDNF